MRLPLSSLSAAKKPRRDSARVRDANGLSFMRQRDEDEGLICASDGRVWSREKRGARFLVVNHTRRRLGGAAADPHHGSSRCLKIPPTISSCPLSASVMLSCIHDRGLHLCLISCHRCVPRAKENKRKGWWTSLLLHLFKAWRFF